MLGKNRRTTILVITGRKDRFRNLGKSITTAATELNNETESLLNTNDQGQESSDYNSLSNKLNVKVFIFDSDSSYQ
jgi:IS30 family transposase